MFWDETIHGAVFAALLGECAPLAWAPPWEFLPTSTVARATVADPDQVLAALRACLSPVQLQQSGILQQANLGERLLPALCNPSGALFPIHSSGSVDDLLTDRGAVMQRLPLLTVPDRATAQIIRETGLVFAVSRVRDLALLHALQLPVAYRRSLGKASLASLRALDRRFGTTRDYPAPDPIRATARCQRTWVSGLESRVPATLVLVGWSPCTFQEALPETVRLAAMNLTEARRHAGLAFAGVSVWEPNPGWLAHVRFRIAHRDADGVRSLFLDAADEARDFEAPRTPWPVRETPAERFARARAELEDALREDDCLGRRSARTDQAERNYRAMLEDVLIGPLRTAALGGSDVPLQLVGLELAEVACLLHSSAPCLQELTRRAMDEALAGRGDSLVHALVRQFATLGTRAAQLRREWRRTSTW